MDKAEMLKTRIKMLGGNIENKEVLDYIAMKSEEEVKDFCNLKELPVEASVYVTEWTAANFMTETVGYSKQWERMREEAEKGLVRFRKLRW